MRCVAELRAGLAARGLSLLVRMGDVTTILNELRGEFAFTHLLSHEETGSGWSYQRDITVAKWCRSHSVEWKEYPQTGVVRRLRTRSGWAAAWARRMNGKAVSLDGDFNSDSSLRAPIDPAIALPTLPELGLPNCTVPLPPAGEAAAWHTLDSFLSGRARNYRRAVSSPIAAEKEGSRLSEHLAFGTLSMCSVHQATEACIRNTADAALAQSLRSFAGRLRWHCHFMQKLEDEPQIEFLNFARGHDGLRRDDGSALDALEQQRFEPGIHWSQMQMQSGTTGINTLRTYSPAKQARDHDPLGHYIRRWVPEFGSPAYPSPIVDERIALASAKEHLYGLRKTHGARVEAGEIQQKHGSRKSGLPASGPSKRVGKARPAAPVSGQGELF